MKWPSPFSPRQLTRSAMAALLPYSRFMVRGRRDGNCISLTFDDGPHPLNTPPLLEALRAHCVKATFFVIGREAERYPDVLQRIVAEGHELGHHTFCHGRPERVSAAQLTDEIARTGEIVTRATGTTMRLFRPPWGKLTVAKLLAVWRSELSVVLWNVDPHDGSESNSEAVLRELEGRSIYPGDIVLLHDDMPHRDSLIPRLIELANGCKLTTVSEMLCNASACANPAPAAAV